MDDMATPMAWLVNRRQPVEQMHRQETVAIKNSLRNAEIFMVVLPCVIVVSHEQI